MDTQSSLPAYVSVEQADQYFYGLDVALWPNGQITLQCDKYRDVFTLAFDPDKVVRILQYAQDQGTVQNVGHIELNTFVQLRKNKIYGSVEKSFIMRRTSSPLCVYLTFNYNGQTYSWRAKYEVVDSYEKVKHCTLMRDTTLVAAVVANHHNLSGETLLGRLSLQCHASMQTPIHEHDDLRPWSTIGQHDKAADADLMLVSFVALWFRLLKRSLVRERRHSRISTSVGFTYEHGSIRFSTTIEPW